MARLTFEYRTVLSKRRGMALTVRRGEVIAKAPLRTSAATVRSFVERHASWVEEQLARYRELLAQDPPLTEEMLEELKRQGRELFPRRVAYYAERMGEPYGRVTVKCQKTKWGSCSGKKNLNFNCLLMLAPLEILDYVVVHELCHLREMNHSARFYREVEKVLPDYRARREWLRKNGAALMRRAHGG